jgi:hypothetical protein
MQLFPLISAKELLWTFNDTFVARHPGDARKNSAFVRNTVAIQSGYDPSRASIKFYWRSGRRGPSEIFPSQGHGGLTEAGKRTNQTAVQSFTMRELKPACNPTLAVPAFSK